MTVIENLFQPPVSPSPDALPFWAAADRHELQLPFCVGCEAFFFYPRTLCPTCGSRSIEWRATTGRGVVHTFCIQYQNSVPGLGGAVPFVTAMVELAEGPRLMTLLVGVDPDPAAIWCDMPVQVSFLELTNGHSLPVFRPVQR